MKISGVVVLYNPDDKVYYNILTYINDIDVLYVIDNSDIKDYRLIRKIQKISNTIYIDNKGNRGIAYALNLGAKLALKNGYKWLLTMDQDSKVSKNMIEVMSNFIISHNIDKVAIIASYPLNKFETKVNRNSEFQSELVVITSGNLLNLDIYKKVGGFLNKLFIDQVDYEYCLRVYSNGYKIIKVNKALLYHNLGNMKIISNGYYIYDRSCIRSYYIIRNTLYLLSKYKYKFPEWYIECKNYLIYEDIAKVLIYENYKLRKLLYMIKGLYDFINNKYGKFNSLLR